MSEIKRNSEIINRLRAKRNPKDHNRIRNAMHQSAIISNELSNRGIGRLEFAKMMDKKPSVITKWLSGTQNLTTETLSAIESVLGIELLVKIVPPKNVIVAVKMASFERIKYPSNGGNNSHKAFIKDAMGKVVSFPGNSPLVNATNN